MSDLPVPGSEPCPGADRLGAFFREELPPPELCAIEAHVAGCEACGALIRQWDAANDEPLRQLCEDFAAETPGDSHFERMMRAVGRALSARPVEEEPPPPAQIGQYKLFERIGRGGMGVVFRAQHLRLKRWVAVKLLPPERVHERAVARFEREMEVVGRLDHPNIVRATDAGHADGFHYLAMELIDGADLSQVIWRHGPLPAAQACELVRQAALGLQHAHEHGLVHRDVKPNNLMLSASGEVKVLDLGLALLKGEPTADTLSAHGQVLGTADYMAPEQWEGCHEVDIRADIYSLGCTLYTLLTGAPPFARQEFDTLYKKLKAHHEEPAPPLSASFPVPAALEELVTQMLQKEPARRPQKPADVARALSVFCSGHDLSRLVTANAARPLRSGGPPVSAETGTFQAAPTGQHPTTASLAPAAPAFGRGHAARWGVAGLCVLVASFVALFVRNPQSGQPLAQEPTPETKKESQPGPLSEPAVRPPEPPPRVFRPGEWCELLDRPPMVLLWPEKADNTWKNYDPTQKTLNVGCEDRGMLQLADVAAPSFDLEVTLTQTPWTGGVGVFFRGRNDHIRGAGGAVADFLLIEHIDTKAPHDSAQMVRGEMRRLAAPPHVFSPSFLVTGSFPRPVGGAHRLTLRVETTGLTQVRWDDKTAAQGVCRPSVLDTPRKEAFGSVGVFVQHGAALYRSVRVRVHPAPGAP